MPHNINFPQFAQIWTPIQLSRTEEGRGNHSYLVVGKLKRGVDFRGAQANMTAIASQLAAEFPASNTDVGVTMKPLPEQPIDALFIKLAVTIFMGCVDFLLLIACGNVETSSSAAPLSANGRSPSAPHWDRFNGASCSCCSQRA